MVLRVTTSGEGRATTAGVDRASTTPNAPPASINVLPRDQRRALVDVRLVIGENGADLALEQGDLALDEGLPTAVLVSLFSDGRAPADLALPVGETSRRGWWGEDDGDRFGSLLWLLDREKITAATLARLGAYARQALAWMVEEGIAARVDATAIRTGLNEVCLQVQLHRGRARRWAALWDATDADPLFVAQGLKVQILTL